MPIPDVLGWEWPMAWDECRAQGLQVVAKATHDPRRSEQPVPDPADADESGPPWRVIGVRSIDETKVELIICAEQWSPLVSRS